MFEFVSEVSNNRLWQQGQKLGAWTSEAPPGEGSTFQQRAEFLGRSIESDFEVTEFEPGERIRMVSTSGPMEVDVTRTVTAVDEGRSTVSELVVGEAPGAMKFAGGVIDKFVERSINADYERLKRLLEAPAELPPNHHADYPQFTGAFGYLGATRMLLGGSPNAELVTSVAEIAPGMDVLDVGSGPGVAVVTAARLGANAIGLDPSEPMLKGAAMLARLRPPGQGTVKWVLGGAEDIALPDASVDVCWTVKALHHWPHLEEGLAEVVRVLRPGGQFIVLEKLSAPGATGRASHRWTTQQAGTLAEMLRTSYGFPDAEVSEREAGSQAVLLVVGRLAS